MNTKEKAKELVDKFKDKVNPYIGSGMLSNTHDDSAILWQSKKCAIIALDGIIESLKVTTGWMELDRNTLLELDNDFNYWQEVKQEIINL